MAEYNEGATNGNRLLDTSDDPTAKDSGVLEASEVSIGSVPSELSIDSYEIRKTLEAQNFDLGTESEVARDIFDRSADVNQDGSEAQQRSRWAPPSFSFHSPLSPPSLFLLSLSSPLFLSFSLASPLMLFDLFQRVASKGKISDQIWKSFGSHNIWCTIVHCQQTHHHRIVHTHNAIADDSCADCIVFVGEGSNSFTLSHV